MKERRTVTAAVPGMTVPEMRKQLAEVRTLLTVQSTQRPFALSTVLSSKIPAWKFVYDVAIGLHKKRTSTRTLKTKKKELEEGEVDLGSEEEA